MDPRVAPFATLYELNQDYGHLAQVHHFRLERADQIDRALRALVSETCAIGRQQVRRHRPSP